MAPFLPKVGSVFGFYFLWKRDVLAGRQFASKPHPCLSFHVDPPVPAPGVEQTVRLLGISHTPPLQGERAIELPASVKRELKLDRERQWIYTCHANAVTWWDHVEPVGSPPRYYLGEMNSKFMAQVFKDVLQQMEAGTFQRFKREPS